MKFFSKYSLLLSMLCLCVLGTFAQQDKEAKSDTIFKGIVLDAQSKPLSGVSVYIQEKIGTVSSDLKGEFAIKANVGDVLILRNRGYITQQQILGNENLLSITLIRADADAGEEDNATTPFAILKKRNVSGAVTVLNGSNIPQLPTNDLRNLFAGRLSGLYQSQVGTAPGTTVTNVFMRSINSFNARTARIFVDGTERDFGDMDISEIESITVLKDASTLAWYGLRGGNGVVMVTTKKGDSIRSYIHFDAQVGFQNAINLIKPLNSYDYASLYNEASLNDGAVAPYNQAALDAYRNNTLPFLFPNNNYIEDYLRKTAPIQRYAFSMGGGKRTVRYFASVSYLNQRGFLNNTQTPSFDSNVGFRKLNFRGNIDFEANKYLTVSLHAGVRTENRLSPGTGLTDVMNNIYNTPPNAYPILNADGSLGGTAQYTKNLLGLLQQSGYTSDQNRVLLATLSVRQKLDFWIPGLSFNAVGSYDGVGNYISGLTQQYSVADQTLANPANYLTASPVAYRTTTYGNNALQNEFWAGFDYEKTLGSHHLNVSLKGQRFADKAPERLDFRNQGLAGRIDYNYKQRYFAGFTAGYSGSENFAPGKRYGFFPAISAGWILSEEKFLKSVPILSYLKLRASYGSAGNGDIGGSRFPFESFYSRNLSSGGYSFGLTPTATNSASESNLGNPNITWETVRMLNTGFDVRFLNDALGLSVDYYQTRRDNILTANIFPSLIGQDAGLVNGGKVQSRGLESSVFYSKKLGKLEMNFNGNVLISKSKVLAENGQEGLPLYQQTVGHIAGSTLVFLSDGLFQSQAEINSHPQQTLAGRVAPGDIKYKDIGGPLGVPDGIIDNNDQVRIDKTALPNTYYGFGGNLRYGILDLVFQFQGVVGRTINIQGLVNSGPSAFNALSLDRYTPSNAANARFPRLGIADRGNNTAASDYWLRSADYLSLKSLEVGFNLPSKLTTKLGVSNARLYIGALNLFTTNDLGIGVNPEVPNAGSGSTYPYSRTYTLGISVAL
ncbi:SusC/RagA family TonB-linked outer membrane protein [Pedobacter petrophilus]|uniref:SusC/RagA family TonB-linked outer membrane protein n=1 Tax=Pedobacter petrophilus TaxID=1908241 RepID=A0A7K0G5N7_9SPHI|nr:SusC/RagA family TonB-linked outer membrane protein [Pedobacter petrophilus]MRX78316.1 SusC/RagA family TonB-linked outer membrane protein [Pedobacter petrophilus]